MGLPLKQHLSFGQEKLPTQAYQRYGLACSQTPTACLA